MPTVQSNPNAPGFASSPDPGARSTGYARLAFGHPGITLSYNFILCKLGLGARTEVGLRVVVRFASVIATCWQCGHSPWPYIEAAIAIQRAGPLAPLPQPGE
jgi:hypothetical protein